MSRSKFFLLFTFVYIFDILDTEVLKLKEKPIMAQRIRDLRRERGLTQAQLADKTGLKETAIRSYENGLREPNAKALAALEQYFQISVNYLLGNIDDKMKLKDEIVSELPLGERTLQEQLREVSDEEKLILSGFVPFFVSYQRSLKPSNKENALYFPYRLHENAEEFSDETAVYELPASAGTGLFLDSDDYRMIKFRPNTIPRGTSFGVRISGFSMVPSIQDGEVVFVKRQPYLDDGDVGIFVLNGDAYCKRYRSIGGVRLESDNSMFFHPIEVKESDDLRILGKVIGHARPLHP